MIRYFCTNGTRVSQAVIKQRYSLARFDKAQASTACEGCGGPAHSFAHIIAQARCKVLHKTELIWDLDNFFASCLSCNQAIENPKGQAWKQLANLSHCLSFIEQHDQELYAKFMVNS